MLHIQIEDGLAVHLLQTRKFKTNVTTVLLRTDLTREKAVFNSVLAGVLRSGCEKYQSALEIAKKCEEMYGAELEIGVVKKGEEHLLQLYFEASGGLDASLFEDTGKLLHELIFEPLVTDGGFKEGYVEQQLERQREVIAGRKNDKKKYARERCIEIMCGEERFGIPGDGYEEDLEHINAKNLYEHYNRVMRESPIEIGIIGDLSGEYCEAWAKRYFTGNRGKIVFCTPASVTGAKGVLSELTERMGLSQGKLALGARCDFSSKGEDFYKLLLFSEIVGGGANSKLFKKIREKHSLCYYVNSIIFRAKALMLIQAGIDEKDYNAVMGHIKAQFQSIKSGEVSEDELEVAKLAIISQLETLKDSPQGLMDFYMTNVLLDDYTEINEIRTILNGFTKKDVCECVDRTSFETAYFLV